ncbi:hypothetical protein HGRIS_010481 [Hohenbuehelia grisea]|uniref:Uncharacterized protein n=1 Tax=Hohenbuehelia grisea TaxID=104357 RepID=A0ABR3IZ79_9AGAR
MAKYFEHTNRIVTYGSLSRTLCSHYQHALDILGTTDTVEASKQHMGVTDDAQLDRWLQEERQYLDSLQEESSLDRLDIEYYAARVWLMESEERCRAIGDEWRLQAQGEANQPLPSAPPKTITNVCRHAIEENLRLREIVKMLEAEMVLDTPWPPGGLMWNRAKELHEF